MRRKIILIILLVISLLISGCDSKNDSSKKSNEYQVSGKIIDNDGKVVEGVNLSFSESYGTAKTDLNGEWQELRDLIKNIADNPNRRWDSNGPYDDRITYGGNNGIPYDTEEIKAVERVERVNWFARDPMKDYPKPNDPLFNTLTKEDSNDK